MQKRVFFRAGFRTLLLAVVLAVICAISVRAQQSSSNSYEVDEAFFGSGGEVEMCSGGDYCSQGSLGSLGVGRTSSASYDLEAGYLTQNEAYLEMKVEAAIADLGTLQTNSTSSAAAQGGSCNCSFSVRTYLTSSYAVYTLSDPPTSENGDILTAKASQGAVSSDPDIEEFGINLVDNSSPDVGANPANVPDDSFADGYATAGYGTANQFKYQVGDMVAGSPETPGNQGTGQTNYTVSYIAKRNAVTPAGVYVMGHLLTVVPTY